MKRAESELMAPASVGVPLPHESAALHVSGRATYVDDIAEARGTLHCAFGLAQCAHGRIVSLDLDAVKRAPGVVAVLTAADVPSVNNCGPSPLHDDPLMADGLVQFYGQPLFLVAAESHDAARKAARKARVEYDVLPAFITAAEAVEAESWLVPPVGISRGNVEEALQFAPHRLKGKCEVGGQEHFYLEGQIAYALPREDDSMHLHVSTQHPTEMQHLVARMLGWRSHQVSVECRRMGGAFGGKESQSGLVACAAALVAQLTKRPAKIRLDRDDDMSITGKRHDFHMEYEVGFSDKGEILGLRIDMASRCGYSMDLSVPVNDRAMFHVDNCYYLDAVTIRSMRCRTNTVSNTAFRGFGGPQGMFVIEYVMDDISRHLGADPLEVRQVNFYSMGAGIPPQERSLTPKRTRDTTPYGMTVEDNIAPFLVEKLARDCEYARRRAEVASFNVTSPIIKRGLALTPVKFGISFTATMYNQAGAVVHVYADGTVLVTHGGTEMGQGLYTKIRQIVAHEFGLPLDDVRLASTDTSRVPNTSATAASSGSDLNGKAAQQAAIAIRERLAAFIARRDGVEPESVRFENAQVVSPERRESFEEVASAAYRDRIKLWESGFYRTPKIHYDPKTLNGRPFFYFSYGAACAEVALDTLTGESRVLRVDILHDVGKSLNPALDIGQIEGGFVQGMGWLTTEELWFHLDGPQRGQLMTHAPSTYKIPTVGDVPAVFNVKLFDNANVEDTIHRSKAVGEPPFMLAFSVFFALRDAASAAAGRAVSLRAPATPESLLRAIQEAA